MEVDEVVEVVAVDDIRLIIHQQCHQKRVEHLQYPVIEQKFDQKL